MQGTQLGPLWWTRWMGWGVRKGYEGTNVYIELVHFKVQQILTQHLKATTFQEKNFSWKQTDLNFKKPLLLWEIYSIYKSRDNNSHVPLPSFKNWTYGLSCFIYEPYSLCHLPFPKSVQFSSVAQSCPTRWPQEWQHARPPCSSPPPRVYSNSHPLSRWCHPAISFSVSPSPTAPNPSQH